LANKLIVTLKSGADVTRAASIIKLLKDVADVENAPSGYGAPAASAAAPAPPRPVRSTYESTPVPMAGDLDGFDSL
jgi:hypothetical protein